jgi:hypothetical protein
MSHTDCEIITEFCNEFKTDRLTELSEHLKKFLINKSHYIIKYHSRNKVLNINMALNILEELTPFNDDTLTNSV